MNHHEWYQENLKTIQKSKSGHPIFIVKHLRKINFNHWGNGTVGKEALKQLCEKGNYHISVLCRKSSKTSKF